MPSLRVRIKNQVHKGLLEPKDAERLIFALDHEDERIEANKKEEAMQAIECPGAYGQLIYRCPICKRQITVHECTRYCEYCGQKLTFVRRIPINE